MELEKLYLCELSRGQLVITSTIQPHCLRYLELELSAEILIFLGFFEYLGKTYKLLEDVANKARHFDKNASFPKK